jgi:hypothetical protein
VGRQGSRLLYIDFHLFDPSVGKVGIIAEGEVRGGWDSTDENKKWETSDANGIKTHKTDAKSLKSGHWFITFEKLGRFGHQPMTITYGQPISPTQAYLDKKRGMHP